MKGAQVGRLYPRTSVWLFAALSQLGKKPGQFVLGHGHPRDVPLWDGARTAGCPVGKNWCGAQEPPLITV